MEIHELPALKLQQNAIFCQFFFLSTFLQYRLTQIDIFKLYNTLLNGNFFFQEKSFFQRFEMKKLMILFSVKAVLQCIKYRDMKIFTYNLFFLSKKHAQQSEILSKSFLRFVACL